MQRAIQDLRRSIDYLESRPEIDHQKLAYFGLSHGGIVGPIALAVEPRLKTAILTVAGLMNSSMPVETDPFQFAPRVHVPVLILNGRYDVEYDLETSQKPLLQVLGTPAAHKRLVLLEAGHAMVGFPASTRESLNWFDKYLGPAPMPVLK